MAWQSVVDAFLTFTTSFEGDELFMYTDAEGYVTTGIGNLIDPIGSALALPWKNPDGSLASQGDITAAWNTVKTAWPGVQSVNCASLTTIRLNADDVSRLVQGSFATAESTLRTVFPAYDSWPADGQMGILSGAWAMGAAAFRGFPQLQASLNATPPRFADAAPPLALAHFRGVGIAGRIAANDVCFANADYVVQNGLDPSALYWPGLASQGAAPNGGGSLVNLLPAMLGLFVATGVATWSLAPRFAESVTRMLKGWL
jgi:hypothetical protein